MNNQFLAVFDSGFGGLSVLKHLLNLLPNENYIYFADSTNIPYGLKTREQIIEFSKSCINYLSQYDLKSISIACNTATVNALDDLTSTYEKYKFIGTKPDISIIFENDNISNNDKKSILIIATTSTCNSQIVKEQIAIYENVMSIKTLALDKIVQFVESNNHNTDECKNYLYENLKSFSNYDYILLGCTHFYFIKNHISKILDKTKIIDCGYYCAKNTYEYLSNNNLLNDQNESKIIIYDSSKNQSKKQLFFELLERNDLEFLY